MPLMTERELARREAESFWTGATVGAIVGTFVTALLWFAVEMSRVLWWGLR